MKKNNLIIGRQPLIETIRSGRAVDKILLQRNTTGDSVEEIRQLAREYNIPVQVVPVEKLASLTRANHQGVVAFAGLVQYLDLQQVIDHTVSEGAIPLLVMLDGVTDVRNIGAIARSALCCGAQALIIPDKGTGALNEEAMEILCRRPGTYPCLSRRQPAEGGGYPSSQRYPGVHQRNESRQKSF